MIKVRAERTDVETVSVDKARCPICDKMLFGIEYVKGVTMLRAKCPRCKNYINIDLTGNCT